METGPDTLAEFVAKMESATTEDEIRAAFPPLDPTQPLPSWEELGRPDLMGSPSFITTDQGTTFHISPASMAVKKTRAGLDEEST
jgi:hypothetical protein